MALISHDHDHHHTAKTFLAFLILVVGFVILIIFVGNADHILREDKFHTFMTLAVIGCGLLVGLLYLVNNSHHVPSKSTSRSSAKKVKSKRKK